RAREVGRCGLRRRGARLAGVRRAHRRGRAEVARSDREGPHQREVTVDAKRGRLVPPTLRSPRGRSRAASAELQTECGLETGDALNPARAKKGRAPGNTSLPWRVIAFDLDRPRREGELVPWLPPPKHRQRDQFVRSPFWQWMTTRWS